MATSQEFAYLASFVGLADVVDISLAPVVILAHDDRVHAPHFALEIGRDGGIPSGTLDLLKSTMVSPSTSGRGSTPSGLTG